MKAPETFWNQFATFWRFNKNLWRPHDTLWIVLKSFWSHFEALLKPLENPWNTSNPSKTSWSTPGCLISPIISPGIHLKHLKILWNPSEACRKLNYNKAVLPYTSICFFISIFIICQKLYCTQKTKHYLERKISHVTEHCLINNPNLKPSVLPEKDKDVLSTNWT